MISLIKILNEDSFTPGTKIHYKKGMSDDEILDLASKLGNFPHTKLKGAPEQQKHFRDLGWFILRVRDIWIRS